MRIYVFFLIAFSPYGLCDDDSFQKEIIGSWIISQQDEYFSTEWFITEYKADGTAFHRQFKDASCETTLFVINGHWTIQDGKLINVVLSSSGEFDIPSGIRLIDNIVKLSNNEMIISTDIDTDTNRTAHRMKSDKCL